VSLAFIIYILLFRYLTWYEAFLSNLDKSHPGAKELLQKGGFAVARSLIPGTLNPVDKTMEETFMRFAKSQGEYFCNKLAVNTLYRFLTNYIF